jgi:hypothetical protein
MTTQKASSVGTVFTLVLTFTLFLSHDLNAGGHRRAVAAPRPSSELAITFVDGIAAAAAVVDAGPMAWRGVGAKLAKTSRTVGIRIGSPSREPRGTATLRAFLETADPGCVVRVDGVVLSHTPRVVQRHAPIGVAVAHRIEIEVPATAAEGPIATSIGWEVTTD